jgi:Skp family chaperone for outer membrane proteins
MPMDTSPSPQPNKPTFGTSDFAVSTVEPSGYIDATAEETCPAASVPMSEPDKRPQHAAGEAAEAPSAASLEVMDQLKALAQNVTQGDRASFVQSDAPSVQSNMSEGADASDPAGSSQATEPSISVFPRPTGFENIQVINDRPKFGNQVLTLAGFAVAALIGAGSTFAWQAHLKSNDVAIAAPGPVAAAPAISPDVSKQLEALAQGISSELAVKQQQLAAAQQQLEQLAAKQQQLAAKQEQVGQSIAKLQALEQARQRTPAPVQSRAAPVPPRPSVPPPPVDPPPLAPRTAEHPIPPLPVPMAR